MEMSSFSISGGYFLELCSFTLGYLGPVPPFFGPSLARLDVPNLQLGVLVAVTSPCAGETNCVILMHYNRWFDKPWFFGGHLFSGGGLNLHDILCHLLVNDVHSFWWCLNNASIIHELESNPSAGNYKWVNLQPLTIWIWIFSSMFRRCKKMFQ